MTYFEVNLIKISERTINVQAADGEEALEILKTVGTESSWNTYPVARENESFHLHSAQEPNSLTGEN